MSARTVLTNVAIAAIAIFSFGLVCQSLIGEPLPAQASGRTTPAPPPPPPTSGTTETPPATNAVTESADGVDGAPPQALPDGFVTRAISNFFGELVTTMARDDHAAFAATFDASRMFQELRQLKLVPQMTRPEQLEFTDGLLEGIEQSARRYGGDMRWVDYDITSVFPLGPENEYVVCVRSRDARGDRQSTRWWLRRDADEWKVYDVESLSSGIRYSTTSGLVAGLGRTSVPPWFKDCRRLVDAASLLAADDLNLARKTLAELRHSALPRYFEATRLMLLSIAQCSDRNFEAALRSADEAASFHDDFPLVDYVRAISYNGIGEHEKAVDAINAYDAVVGSHADCMFQLGEARRGLGQFNAAMLAFAKGLDDDVDSLDCLVGLGLVAEDAGIEEFAERFSRMSNADELFETVAIYLLDAGRSETVERLVQQHKKRRPRDPNAGYYLARVRMTESRYEEAAALLREALPLAPADERQMYLEFLMDALVMSSRQIEAYNAAEDAGYGFRYVAESLLWQEDDPGLMELIIVHRETHPRDPWIHYYTGESYLLQGNPTRASVSFVDGLAQAADEAVRTAYETALARAYYYDGRLDKAYNDLPPHRLRARELAALCIDLDDRIGLESLIRMHTRAESDDPAIVIWQAEQYWMAGNYESVVSTLGPPPDGLADDELGHHRTDRMVRSLVRLQRYPEALRVARESTARDGNPYLEVIVYAASGQLDAAERAMRRSVEMGIAPELFLEDPDAGPVLQAEPVATAEGTSSSP